MFNKEKPVEVLVDKTKCTKCGLCINLCSSFLKKDNEGFPTAQCNEESLFGCIQCGSCMMICPNDAIEIKGEDIDKKHLRDLNPKLPDYEAVNSLFLKRRSCRKFLNQEVLKEDIDKIINSAATAAVSIPPSEVKVLVINGKEKVQELADDVIDALKNIDKVMNPLILGLMRIFAGKAQYRIFKEFVLPLCKELVESRKNGLDYLLYDAPAVMIFYGTEYSDKEDQLLAANQATIAAEALGLGTCFIGTLGAVLQQNKKLRKKYGILKGEKVGTSFILGYPEVKYRKGFQRNFKKVTFM